MAIFRKVAECADHGVFVLCMGGVGIQYCFAFGCDRANTQGNFGKREPGRRGIRVRIFPFCRTACMADADNAGCFGHDQRDHAVYSALSFDKRCERYADDRNGHFYDFAVIAQFGTCGDDGADVFFGVGAGDSPGPKTYVEVFFGRGLLKGGAVWASERWYRTEMFVWQGKGNP